MSMKVVHGIECPYWHQSLLNNTKLTLAWNSEDSYQEKLT